MGVGVDFKMPTAYGVKRARKLLDTSVLHVKFLCKLEAVKGH